jgi:hypothetical protein
MFIVNQHQEALVVRRAPVVPGLLRVRPSRPWQILVVIKRDFGHGVYR